MYTTNSKRPRNLWGCGLLVSWFAFAPTLRAQDAPALCGQDASVQRGQNALVHLLQAPQLRAATVAVEVVRLTSPSQRTNGATSTVLCQYDSQRAVLPASTLKLVTTASALRLCGSERRVATEVYAAGTISAAGVLCGDLVVRGYGDATLASVYDSRPERTFVDSVIVALRRAGIRSVAGRVIGDANDLRADAVAPDWTWEDMGNYYAAGLYGLNYAANTYTLVLDTSHPGSQPRVLRTEPEIPGLEIDNRLSTASVSRDSAYLYGAPGEMRRTLTGAVPQRSATFTVKGDHPDPPLMAATELRRALQRAGIAVKGTAESDRTLSPAVVPTSSLPIYTHWSAPLSRIARQTNLHSQNLLAEMLLRQIALQQESALGTTTTSSISLGSNSTAGLRSDASLRARDLIAAYWRNQGLDLTGVRLYDGCGLSPNDRLTAHFLVQLLTACADDTAFVQSLPIAGREGTVQSFLRGTSLAGRARLKSGTTKQVVAYAGYLEGTEDSRYALALFVNNYDGKPSDIRALLARFLTTLFEDK
jgi:D-alanyl-D-alanine carboxypeptidase/D-alanyl-D-alanine-endopeptidase (penicillin-binding protein 4)